MDNQAHALKRKDFVWMLLTGIFIAHALLAEVIGGKLIEVGPWIMSVGVIPWPIVFLSTDLMNEYFGPAGVKRITWFTMGLISYAFVVLWLAMQVPAAEMSPVRDAAFDAVFGQSLWIIVGSIVAFGVSQLVDVTIFWILRQKSRGRFLWLRATGSTAVSQLVDSLIIIGIAFWLPGKITTDDFARLAFTNYSYKLLIAIGLTPVIYWFHSMIDRYLRVGQEQQV